MPLDWGFYIVEAAAITTAGCAVGAYRHLKAMHNQVEDNADRSIENREMLTGETPDRQGVIPRVREIERRVLHETEDND